MPDDSNIIRLAALQESGELPPTAGDAITLTFADRHAHELRYVAAWGRWLHYDGDAGCTTIPCTLSTSPARSAARWR